MLPFMPLKRFFSNGFNPVRGKVSPNVARQGARFRHIDQYEKPAAVAAALFAGRDNPVFAAELFQFACGRCVHRSINVGHEFFFRSHRNRVADCVSGPGAMAVFSQADASFCCRCFVNDFGPRVTAGVVDWRDKTCIWFWGFKVKDNDKKRRKLCRQARFKVEKFKVENH